MAKRSNPTLVGGFVVGAVVLTIGGVLTFGSGRFFTEEFKMVAHFPSSVAGLDVGAPVRFRGIQVGTVTDIYAVWRDSDEEIRFPVEFVISRESVRNPTEEMGREIAEEGPVEIVQGLIDNQGLRAELNMDSFVTGKLYIALDFHPDVPVRLIGGTKLPEMPTTEANLVKLKKSLEELPVEELVQKALSAIEAVEDLARNPRIEQTLTDLEELLRRLEGEIDPLSSSLQVTLADARTLMSNADGELQAVSSDLQSLLQDTDAQIEPLAASALAALDEAGLAIDRVSGLVSDDSILFYRLATLLDELSGSARAVRNLAAYLERHPEAVVTGKDK